MAEKEKPSKRLSLGSVQAAVWDKQDKDKNTYHSFSFQTRYYDKAAQEWKTGSVFTQNDLLALHVLTGRLISEGIKTDGAGKPAEAAKAAPAASSAQTAKPASPVVTPDDDVPF